MSVPTKLAGFALGLVVVFGAAFGLGRAVGPIGDDAPSPGPTTTTIPVEHDGAHP